MKKEDNKIIFVDDKAQKTTLNILFTYKNITVFWLILACRVR